MVRAMAGAFRDEVLRVGGPALSRALVADLDNRARALNALARRLFAAFLSLL